MHSSVELTLSLLGGLGVFFGGNKLLGDNLRILTGRQFRDLISSMGVSPFAGSLWGTLSGFITWNSRTTTYIMASFVHSRLIQVRQALPIVLWANAGCSLLVFAAVLPLKFLVLVLLGFSGIFLNLEAPHRFRNSYGAMFGLALLLFGLTLIRASASGIVNDPWLQPLLVSMGESPSLSFLMGLLLTVLVQSHLGIILIAIAMTESGLFTVDPMLMIMLGAHAGNSLNTYLLGWRFTGTARQVVMAQVLGTVSGVLLFVGAFWAEWIGHIPFMEAFGSKLTADAGEQAAYLTVLFNLVVPTLLSSLMTPNLRFLERFWPQSEQESLSQTEYIHAYMGNQPETAVVLADREHMRLMKRLPAYLDELRTEREKTGNPGTAVLHTAFGPISERILEFLLGVMQGAVDVGTSARLLNLQNRQKLLAAVEEDVFGLCQILRGRTDKGKAGQLGLSIVECLDTLLLTAIAAAETGDPDERELLLVLTADRGELMERIRKTYLSMEGSLSPDDRSLILYVTHLFERTAWSVGQYGRLLPRGATQ